LTTNFTSVYNGVIGGFLFKAFGLDIKLFDQIKRVAKGELMDFDQLVKVPAINELINLRNDIVNFLYRVGV
jgi:hypothetical protein